MCAEQGKRGTESGWMQLVDYLSSGRRNLYSAWGSGLFPGSPPSLTTTRWRSKRISSWMWPGKTCLSAVKFFVWWRGGYSLVFLCFFFPRFVFFHAFFSAKKTSADISETKTKLSVPIDDKTRAVLVNSFFGWELTFSLQLLNITRWWLYFISLIFFFKKNWAVIQLSSVFPLPRLLLSMHHMPLTEDATEGAAVSQKRVLGVTADGTMWIYHLVQYAQALLNQPKHVQSSQPFSPEQRQAWDR